MSGRLILSDRRGMTLVEVLIALILFGVVTTTVFSFLGSQNESFSRGTERMDVLQNLRFAVNLVEQEVRTAGVNTVEEQPLMVYAGQSVVAFNSDLTSNIRNDPFAVYYDPDAPAGAVTAMTLAQRTTLPGTSFVYPDSAYSRSGTMSAAETITLYFEPDPTTRRTDDYRLMRQVNDRAPDLVSRDLLPTDGAPFFQYYWSTTTPAGAPTVDVVPPDSLPLAHSVPLHGSAADTAPAARIDAVRGVRVSFTATNGLTGTDERQRAITRLIRLTNSGVVRRRVCGDRPILGSALTATAVNQAGGVNVIELTWNRATDEAGGELDVVRYVIWRRLSTETAWGDPYVSIPAGQASYTWTDSRVADADSYVYALAAQDCTPLQSALATAGPISPSGGGGDGDED